MHHGGSQASSGWRAGCHRVNRGHTETRSLIHFSIGNDRMPKAVYHAHAYGHVRKAAAVVSGRAGRLPAWKARAAA